MARTQIGPNITKVGIVYGARTGIVRRHIYAEDNESEYDRELLLAGEAFCFVDIAHHHAGHNVFHQAIRDAVKAHGGVDAVLFHDEPGIAAHRHVQVDPVTNQVTNYTIADLNIDNVKHVTLTTFDGRRIAVPEDKRALTLDEMGYINVPADHPPVGRGHIYDPVTKTFTDPTPAIHPSKQK